MRLIVDIRECEFNDLVSGKTIELRRTTYTKNLSLWEGGYLISIEDIDENTARLNVFVGDDPYYPNKTLPFKDHIQNIILGIREKFRGELENGNYIINPDRFNLDE